MYPWFASAALQEVYQSLEQQRQVLDQLKVYLDQRLLPFQCHVGEHQRNVDQALRNLEVRLKPLRQYIHGAHRNLERVTFHLTGILKDQFETFEKYLATHSDLLEQANRYIEEQRGPFQNYLEDERQTVEIVYQDLVEQRLNRLLQIFAEQQKIVESFRKSEVQSEYETVAEYLDERQKAFERYVRTADFRPTEFFAQLKEIADRYRPEDARQDTLFAKVFEQTCLADEKFRQALAIPAPSGQKQPKQPQKRKSVPVAPVPLQEIELGVDGNGHCAVAG